MCLLDLLCACGIRSREEVEQARRMLCTYLMNLDTNSQAGSMDRDALHKLFPSGYFRGNKEGVQVVSQHLGIRYDAFIYIYFVLGEERTNMVLRAFNIKVDSVNPMTGRYCNGIPTWNVSSSEPIPCTATPGEFPMVTLKGFGLDHIDFCCQRCVRKVARLEYLYLCDKESANEFPLTQAESKRLLELVNQRKKKNQHAVNKRASDIENIGIDAVQVKERITNKEYQHEQASKKLPPADMIF